VQTYEYLIQRISEVTPDLVFVYDLIEDRITYVNQGIERILGYSRSNLAALTALAHQFCERPDLFPDHRLPNLASTSDLLGSVETEVAHYHGGRRWLQARLFVFSRDSQGNITQLLTIAQDITERRVAELALQEANQALRQRIEELSMLNHVAQMLMAWTDLEQMLQSVMVLLGKLFHSTNMSIWRIQTSAQTIECLSCTPPVLLSTVFDYRQSPLVLRIAERGETLLLTNPPDDLFLHAIGVGTEQMIFLQPLVARNVCSGLLCVVNAGGGSGWKPADVNLAQTIAGLLAASLENAQLVEQTRIAAAEEERRRLARELHDSVSQSLLAAGRTADVLPTLWELDPEEGREALGDLHKLTQNALTEMRALLLELRPNAIIQTPLSELLLNLKTVVETRFVCTVQLHLDPTPLLPPDAQLALYRVAQEALNNAAKHAQTTHIDVTLSVTPEPPYQVTLTIRDEGCGFRVPHGQGGFGIETMKERAMSIGAELRLESQPEKGTLIQLHWSEHI
jgi:PAS domain S-box-containing protein